MGNPLALGLHLSRLGFKSFISCWSDFKFKGIVKDFCRLVIDLWDLSQELYEKCKIYVNLKPKGEGFSHKFSDICTILLDFKPKDVRLLDKFMDIDSFLGHLQAKLKDEQHIPVEFQGYHVQSRAKTKQILTKK